MTEITIKAWMCDVAGCDQQTTVESDVTTLHLAGFAEPRHLCPIHRSDLMAILKGQSFPVEDMDAPLQDPSDVAEPVTEEEEQGDGFDERIKEAIRAKDLGRGCLISDVIDYLVSDDHGRYEVAGRIRYLANKGELDKTGHRYKVIA